MRHRIAGNTLNRQTAHRKATVRDLAKATLIQKRICTTKAKAKEGRKMVDKLITLGKKGTLADKRRAFAILCDHKLVSDLFNNTAPRFKERNGGYTRIIPYTNRRGDNAELVFLELTEIEETIISKTKKPKKEKKVDFSKVSKTTEKKSDKAEEPKASETKTKPKKDAKAKTKDESKDKVKKSKTDDKANQKGIVGGLKGMFKRKQPGQ